MAGKRTNEITGLEKEFARRFIELQGSMTNKLLASKTGISEQVIGKYRRGKSKPANIKLEHFQKLCEELKVAPETLLFGKDSQKVNRYLKINYQIIKTNGVRQLLVTATPTKNIPNKNFQERRINSDIYIDLP